MRRKYPGVGRILTSSLENGLEFVSARDLVFSKKQADTDMHNFIEGRMS
jgi:hypothetical protein